MPDGRARVPIWRAAQFVVADDGSPNPIPSQVGRTNIEVADHRRLIAAGEAEHRRAGQLILEVTWAGVSVWGVDEVGAANWTTHERLIWIAAKAVKVPRWFPTEIVVGILAICVVDVAAAAIIAAAETVKQEKVTIGS